MTTIRAHFDGKAFVPDEPVILPTNISVTLHVDAPVPPSSAAIEERLKALDELAKMAEEADAQLMSIGPARAFIRARLMILVDTSIWGRVAVKSDPLYEPAMKALQWVIRHDQPAIAAQSLYEFWVVATRPIDKSGLGWLPSRSAAWMLACRRSCTFLPEDPRLFDVWADLVTTHATKGKPAHNARLAAFMRVYAINTILTFNVADFTRYGITILDPRTMPFN